MRRWPFIVFVLLALRPVNAGAGPVPDTGQTACYGLQGAIACPEAGETFYGQDAQHRTAPRSLVKLDAGGGALPDNATTWAMVRDDVTGLVWAVQEDGDGAADYGNPRDADNRYTWYDDNASRNGGDAGQAGSGTDTADLAAALNSAAFGGFGDWRLPRAHELVWLLDRGTGGPPYISRAHFPAAAGEYWTATTDPSDPGRCATVTLTVGMMNYPAKSAAYSVMAVRGAPRAARFRDNGDGTVSDEATGLMWQQGSVQGISWKDGLAYCRDLELGGYDDWRLPDVNELMSLADYGSYSPSIDERYFTDTSLHYWTSTTYETQPGKAYHVCFLRGRLEVYGKLDQGPASHLRAVRGGITGGGSGTTTTVPPGCLVERIYGSGSPETERLRRFRDEVLAASAAGRRCIDLYGRLNRLVQPYLDSPLFRRAVQTVLDASVAVLGGDGMAATPAPVSKQR